MLSIQFLESFGTIYITVEGEFCPKILEAKFKRILGLQPRDKAAMLGVKTKECFPEEFT